jgi:hypothetical protein
MRAFVSLYRLPRRTLGADYHQPCPRHLIETTVCHFFPQTLHRSWLLRSGRADPDLQQGLRGQQSDMTLAGHHAPRSSMRAM